MPDMITIIKRAAMDAVAAQKPAALAVGRVESENPLEISVDQKLHLKASQLILPRSMSDHELEIELEAETENGGDPAHTHEITGGKIVMVRNALKVGEIVLLLRMQGGQKYLILDRVVNG